MEIKTTNVALQAGTTDCPQKQIYASPQLRVYGSVSQFTQGSKQNGNDGAAGQTKNSNV